MKIFIMRQNKVNIVVHLLLAEKNQSEVCSNIFIHSITQELEKKGFYVDITSDTFYNYFNISWAKKK